MNRSILIIVASVILAVLGQTTLKIGMGEVGRIGSDQVRTFGPTVLRVFSNWKVLGGLALYFGSALLYMVALSRVPLSAAYPIAGLSYLLITLISLVVLREDVPAMRWVGVGVITTGVFIVARTL